MDFDDSKEFDDPQVFHNPKGISIESMEFDNPKVYGDTSFFGLIIPIKNFSNFRKKLSFESILEKKTPTLSLFYKKTPFVSLFYIKRNSFFRPISTLF